MGDFQKYKKIVDLVVNETCNIQPGQLIYIYGPIELYEFMRELSMACFEKGARVDRFEVVDYLYRYDSYQRGDKEAFKTEPKLSFTSFENADWYIAIQPNFYYKELTPKIKENMNIDDEITKGWDGWFGRLSSHGGKFLYINLPTIALSKRTGLRLNELDFLWDALTVPPSELLKIANTYLQRLTLGKKIRLVDEDKGFTIELDTSTRKWILSCGNYDPTKNLFALPGGEIYIAPLEEKTSGELYFKKVSVINEKIEGLYLKINNGRITDIEIKKGGEKFLQDIERVKNYNIIGEFGIGFNPYIKACGAYATDEKAYKTCHFGLGRNTMFGGKIECRLHTDLVKELKYCKLYVDDKLIIENGELK